MVGKADRDSVRYQHESRCKVYVVLPQSKQDSVIAQQYRSEVGGPL